MSNTRRKYSEEYKREAVSLALQPDASIAEVS
ncbi:transposase, partial [Motiliproteus sp. MSK22-1]